MKPSINVVIYIVTAPECEAAAGNYLLTLVKRSKVKINSILNENNKIGIF